MIYIDCLLLPNSSQIPYLPTHLTLYFFFLFKTNTNNNKTRNSPPLTKITKIKINKISARPKKKNPNKTKHYRKITESPQKIIDLMLGFLIIPGHEVCSQSVVNMASETPMGRTDFSFVTIEFLY